MCQLIMKMPSKGTKRDEKRQWKMKAPEILVPWSGEEGGNGRNLTSPDKSRGGPTTDQIRHNLFGGKNPDFFCTYFQH